MQEPMSAPNLRRIEAGVGRYSLKGVQDTITR